MTFTDQRMGYSYTTEMLPERGPLPIVPPRHPSDVDRFWADLEQAVTEQEENAREVFVFDSFPFDPIRR